MYIKQFFVWLSYKREKRFSLLLLFHMASLYLREFTVLCVPRILKNSSSHSELCNLAYYHTVLVVTLTDCHVHDAQQHFILILTKFMTVIFYKYNESVCNIIHHLLEFLNKISKSTLPSFSNQD